MTRTVIVGRDPGRPCPEGSPALVGSQSGERIASWCGLDSSYDLPRFFDLVNLVPQPTLAILRTEGSLRALALLRQYPSDTRLILLGNDVHRAFDYLMGLHYQETTMFSFRNAYLDAATTRYKIASVPHPSGRNYFWNDPDNVRRAEKFFTTERRRIENDEQEG